MTIHNNMYLSFEIVETFHETSLQRQFFLSVYIRNLCTFASLYLQIQFDEFRRDWRCGVKKYKNSIIQ